MALLNTMTMKAVIMLGAEVIMRINLYLYALFKTWLLAALERARHKQRVIFLKLCQGRGQIKYV